MKGTWKAVIEQLQSSTDKELRIISKLAEFELAMRKGTTISGASRSEILRSRARRMEIE